MSPPPPLPVPLAAPVRPRPALPRRPEPRCPLAALRAAAPCPCGRPPLPRPGPARPRSARAALRLRDKMAAVDSSIKKKSFFFSSLFQRPWRRGRGGDCALRHRARGTPPAPAAAGKARAAPERAELVLSCSAASSGRAASAGSAGSAPLSARPSPPRALCAHLSLTPVSFGTATAALSQRVPSRSPPRRLRRRPKPAVPPRCPPFRGVSPHGALGVLGAASPPPPRFPSVSPSAPHRRPSASPLGPQRHGGTALPATPGVGRWGRARPCPASPTRPGESAEAAGPGLCCASPRRPPAVPGFPQPILPLCLLLPGQWIPCGSPSRPVRAPLQLVTPGPGLSSLQEAVAVLRGFFSQIQRAQPAASTAVHEGCSQAPEPWRQAVAEAPGFRNTCTLSRQTSLAKTGL